MVDNIIIVINTAKRLSTFNLCGFSSTSLTMFTSPTCLLEYMNYIKNTGHLAIWRCTQEPSAGYFDQNIDGDDGGAILLPVL